MANRYWVGGTATWDGTAGTKWSTTSGGAGGASVPTSADDVFFNASSGTGTVTITAGNTGAKSINCTGFTGTISGTSSILVGGSVTLVSSMTFTYTGGITITGAGFITTAGKTLNSLSIVADVSTVTLSDDLTCTAGLSLTSGTFFANNKTVTCATFASNNSNTRSISMGSGLWTLTGSGIVWNTPDIRGLTFIAGTANILLSNTTSNDRSFLGGNLSYNKLTIGGSTGVSTTSIGAGSSFTELASTKTVSHTIRILGNLGTIGIWSVTGTSGNIVNVISSSTTGIRRTFTLTNETSGIDYLYVKDIGELSGFKFAVGVNSSDGGNNQNVYFSATPPPPPKGNGLFFGSNF